jgi:hypothetical protein
METIYTVLSTLGVGALAFAFAGVIRLSRRVNDLELIRMELVDMEGEFEKQIEQEIRDREHLEKFCTEYMNLNNSNMDRRFDKVWNEIHIQSKKGTIEKNY